MIPREIKLLIFTFLFTIATLQWVEYTYGENAEEPVVLVTKDV